MSEFPDWFRALVAMVVVAAGIACAVVFISLVVG